MISQMDNRELRQRAKSYNAVLTCHRDGTYTYMSPNMPVARVVLRAHNSLSRDELIAEMRKWDEGKTPGSWAGYGQK